MGWGGIAAIFFSTVCVLLWIFVLGFWAGQRIAEKKYAQGAFLQQAQPVTPETAPPSSTSPPSAQEPKQAEDSRTAAPSSAVPLEQVAPTTDQLAQEQSIKPEAAESIKPVKPEVKPDVKPSAKPAQSVVEEKHGPVVAAKPAAEKPKAAVSAPPAKETKPAPGHEAAKKEVKPSTSVSDAAKVEEKIKKLEEKKAGTAHAEPAKSVPVAFKTEAKPASSGSYYTLQVAAFKDKSQAETELKKFESKGLKGKIRTVDLGPEKGTWTRVYIGRYETIEKAKAAQSELASQGHSKPSYIVMLQD